MTTSSLPAGLAPGIRKALEAKGYTSLTRVQEAVLDPASADRDLRISSQTGSGKTIAIGIVLERMLSGIEERITPKKGAAPAALIITPTRELAAQVKSELGWALANNKISTALLSGGMSYRDELRSLQKNPEVIVATPGRLLDHIEQKNLDVSHVQAVVLDEADQMLDLGFREALQSILSSTPSERRTHLVSATFSSSVLSLAKRYQRDAIHIEGTKLGVANIDIQHIAYVVPMAHRLSALINILLMYPDDHTLVFVRTRADTAGLTHELSSAGFSAAALSGDMAQMQRTRTLAAFKSGTIKTLVATDVAARGLDVKDVRRVIHFDLPSGAENYTHRSGRTGRAGKKGTSILLVAPNLERVTGDIMRRAKIELSWRPVPQPHDVYTAIEQIFAERLNAPQEEGAAPPVHVRHLAVRLLAESEPLTLVMRLLEENMQQGMAKPRDIPVARKMQDRFESDRSRRPRDDRGGPPRREAPRRGPGRDTRNDARGDTRSEPRYESRGKPKSGPPKRDMPHQDAPRQGAPRKEAPRRDDTRKEAPRNAPPARQDDSQHRAPRPFVSRSAPKRGSGDGQNPFRSPDSWKKPGGERSGPPGKGPRKPFPKKKR